MTKDIKNRKDIELLINSFYDKVKEDAVIGFFFTEVVQVNWEKHLPVMYDFWENVVFQTSNYNGNPMDKHIDLNKKSAIAMKHFQRWTLVFNETVDELFSGTKADLIKQRALSIATVMQIKILQA